MKTKILILMSIVSLMLTILPCNLSYAQKPEITRQYISRKIGGENSTEEKVKVDYTNLQIKKGVTLRVSFLNANNAKIGEYLVDISSDALIQNKLFIDSERFKGTKNIEIEITGSNAEFDRIKFPFQI